MTLPERLAALTAERARMQALHERAVAAVNEAAVELIRIEAQIALLEELGKEEPPSPLSGA